MEKDELFRKYVKKAHFKLNSKKTTESNSKSSSSRIDKKYPTNAISLFNPSDIKQRVLKRNSIFLILCQKLDQSIRKAINLLNSKMAECEKRVKMLENNQDVDTVQQDPTDKLLAKQYQKEIEDLREMHENRTGVVSHEMLTKDEDNCRTGIIMSLMYLASLHK